MERTYLGMDVGGTYTKICVTDAQLRIKKSFQCPTDKSKDIAVFLSDMISSIQEEFPDLCCASLGLPGTVDLKAGTICTAPSIVKGKREIRKELEEASGLPIAIENDVACWGIAEGHLGVCRGMKDYILITLGTGIGSCLVLDGRVYKGSDGAAGEIGYMVFPEDLQKQARSGDEFGSFEEKASAAAIVRGYQKQKGVEMEVGEIYQDFKNPENLPAKEYFSQKMDYLSVGLANLMTILHPQAIVIGGSITREWELLKPALDSRISRLVSNRIPLLKSETGEYGGALGAILNAQKTLKQSRFVRAV